jgi:hypothetical protein
MRDLVQLMYLGYKPTTEALVMGIRPCALAWLEEIATDSKNEV